MSAEFANAGSGGTYYLAPNGSTSNCGSQTRPCRAPDNLPALKPGALVLAKAGRYDDWNITGRRGASGNPILIRSQSGARDVVIAGSVEIVSSAYVVLSDVIADGGSLRSDDSNDVEIKNSRAQASTGHGIRIRRSPRLHLTNVEVDTTVGNCIDGYVPTPSGYRGDPVEFSQGVVIDSVTLQNCGGNGIYIITMDPIIRNSVIRNIGVVKQDPRVHGIYTKADNALIENNFVEGTVHNGITTRNTAIVRGNFVRNVGLTKGPSSLYGGACYRFYNDGPQNGGVVVFENNICGGGGPQFAGGVVLDGTDTQAAGYTFLIRNNTLYGALSASVSLSNLSKARVSLQHNILVKSDGGKIVSGSSGTLISGTNFSLGDAGAASGIFANALGSDFRLVQPITAAAQRLGVEWLAGQHSVSLSDAQLRSATPADKDGNSRNILPGLGALER